LRLAALASCALCNAARRAGVITCGLRAGIISISFEVALLIFDETLPISPNDVKPDDGWGAS
jgi:hypothetical protein